MTVDFYPVLERAECYKCRFYTNLIRNFGFPRVRSCFGLIV